MPPSPAAIERERDMGYRGMRWDDFHSDVTFKGTWRGPPPRLDETLNKGFISPRAWSNSHEGLWESRGRAPLQHARSDFSRAFQSPERRSGGAATAVALDGGAAWAGLPPPAVPSSSNGLAVWQKNPNFTPRRSPSTPEICKRALQGRQREPAHLRVPGAVDPFGKLKQPRLRPPPPEPAPFTARNYAIPLEHAETVQAPRVLPPASCSTSTSSPPLPSLQPRSSLAVGAAPAHSPEDEHAVIGLGQSQSSPALSRSDAWSRASPGQRASQLMQATQHQAMHRAALLQHRDTYTRWRVM